MPAAKGQRSGVKHGTPLLPESTANLSVGRAGVGVGYEDVPHLLSPIGGHVESSVLEKEGHKLEVDVHTLGRRRRRRRRREGEEEGEGEGEEGNS